MTTLEGGAGRSWHRTTVIGRTVKVAAAEIDGRPGVCADCGRLFGEHADEELQACAVVSEDTLPTGAEA